MCEGGQLPAAGALLALPALAATGVLEAFETTFADRQGRPAFYDIRALVLTVALSALLGAPRAQRLTPLAPVDLRRLIGYDRTPEVENLRRRLGELASLSRSDVLLETFARRHLHQAGGDPIDTYTVVADDPDRTVSKPANDHCCRWSRPRGSYWIRRASRPTPSTSSTYTSHGDA